jgi:hypothetical protein
MLLKCAFENHNNEVLERFMKGTIKYPFLLLTHSYPSHHAKPTFELYTFCQIGPFDFFCGRSFCLPVLGTARGSSLLSPNNEDSG